MRVFGGGVKTEKIIWTSHSTQTGRKSRRKEGVAVKNGWILDDFLATRTDRGVVVRFGRDWSGVTGVRPTD